MWDSFQCFKYQLKAGITTKGLYCAIQAKDFIQTHVRRKFEENNLKKKDFIEGEFEDIKDNDDRKI